MKTSEETQVPPHTHNHTPDNSFMVGSSIIVAVILMLFLFLRYLSYKQIG